MALIEQLPQTSRFMCEVMQNDEIAWQVIVRNRGELPHGKDVGPPLYEFDQHAQLLTLIAERLAELTSIEVAIASGKTPHKVPPLPRPQTALQRARERWNMQQRDRAASLFAPKKE